jgi:AcrR family transcriptional regulator
MSTPATIGSAIADSPITGPKAPNTFGISDSGKHSLSIPKPCGMSSAPNPPCSARVAISISGDCATAHSRDITVNPAEPIRNSRRRPKMSPSRALAILREEGLEAVTMRRVAAALDTGPASLYVYIRGRDELREAMLDRVSASVAIEEPDPARWREQLHALAAKLLAALEAHPGIASVAVGNPPTNERTLLIGENMLGLLLAGDIAPRDAAWACDILPLIITATALETAVHQARHHTEAATAERLGAAFSAMSAERFPLMTRSVDELTSGAGDERFRFAIDVFLDGLVARSHRG